MIILVHMLLFPFVFAKTWFVERVVKGNKDWNATPAQLRDNQKAAE